MDDRGSLDRLKSLFERASELPAGARRDLLDRDCAGDAALREEVERLLALHDAAGSFLPSGPAPAPAPAPSPSDAAGRRIGPYWILEKIGEGGFGTVYLAQQQQPIQRKVALKLVRAGSSSAQVLARFQAERQLLALMDHPNIAVVLDAGVTEGGDPYFVMEYVAGPPITSYADEQRLEIDDRLRLFQQLCEAIQHAHQKGVIHRDLKPSNVLVTRAGEKPLVKVIDFGVAKALGVRFTQETLHTEAGVVIGTPEYMSPEQASSSSRGVDTRTDVYSLGVILFELLVGGLPFERRDTPNGDLLGLLQLIRDKEPPRLTAHLGSRGAEAEGVAARRQVDRSSLARRLRGDLESIVLKALEKDPSRRYSSAAALSDDIGRHLGNLPVYARPPSTAYQIRKLVARHRAVAAVGSAFVIALVFFGVAMSVMYSRQRVERRKAEHVSAFLQDMLSASDPERARGEQVLARDILDQAARKVTTELAGDAELRGAVLETLSRAYAALGLPSESLALSRSGLQVADQRHGRNSVERAVALRTFGESLLAAGKLDSSAVALSEAAAILETKKRSHPLEAARAQYTLAVTLSELGRLAEAERRYRDCIAVFRERLGRDDPEYAAAVNGLSVTLEGQGRFAEAEVTQREALAINQARYGADHPDVLTNVSNLALLLRKQRKYAEAESLYRANIATERKVLGDSHPILAKGLNNLAVLLKSLGRYDEAESLYTESLSIRRRVLGNDHPDVASSLNNLAALYVRRGRGDEAERLYREALAIRLEHYGEDHVDVATVRHNLAALFFSQAKLAEAEEAARRALDTRSKAVGSSHPDAVTSAQLLAQILLRRQRPAEARKLIETCLEGQAAAKDVDAVAAAWSRSLLGQCVLREGDAAAAETLLVGSLDPILGDATIGKGRQRAALQATIEALTRNGRSTRAAELQAKLDGLSQP